MGSWVFPVHHTPVRGTVDGENHVLLVRRIGHDVDRRDDDPVSLQDDGSAREPVGVCILQSVLRRGLGPVHVQPGVVLRLYGEVGAPSIEALPDFLWGVPVVLLLV